MDIFWNKKTDKVTDLYTEPIHCNGCDRTFCITLHLQNSIDEKEKYCGDCFFHKYGLKEYQFAISKLNFIQVELWTKQLSEVSPEIMKLTKFVGGEND